MQTREDIIYRWMLDNPTNPWVQRVGHLWLARLR
jgi:hypothetical protein